MEKPSPAYLLAQGLYNRLNTERLGENFTQNIPGHRIRCTGEVNGQPAVQTLNLAKTAYTIFLQPLATPEVAPKLNPLLHNQNHILSIRY
jgi:hypothetical protein